MEMTDLKKRFSGYSTEQFIELIASMEAKINVLTHELYGRRSERRHEDPVGITPLFNDVEEAIDEEQEAEVSDEETSEVKGHSRKKRGKRAPLPDNLPRRRVEHDLAEQEKTCPKHGTPLTRIGEKVTEQLDYIPSKLEVIENVTFSYKCECCSKSGEETLVSSKSELQPLPKSFATPSLLAYILHAKYVLALPLYRIEKEFARIGVELTRTTTARWVVGAADLLRPLWDMMMEEALDAEALCCDETPVQVLNEPQRTAQQKSYMWVLLKPYGAPIVLFHYFTGRSGKTAAQLLDGFKGTLACDGLKSYDSMAKDREITLAGCLAHIRRKFYLAEKAAKRQTKGAVKASIPLRMIRQLYAIEENIRDRPPDEKRKIRQEKSVPIMDELKKWLDDEVSRSLPKSLLGKAIGYALDQWDKMLVFLSNGLVPIDNNGAERCIRPFVIGRKNWLFCARPSGAEASAMIYSIVETAKANKIDPYSYLTLVFKELPKAQTLEDFERLLPHHIAKHYEVQEYRQPK